jgi:ABC-type multidrug transport system permease subunit
MKKLELVLAYILASPFIVAIVVYLLVNFLLENTFGRLMNWMARTVNND